MEPKLKITILIVTTIVLSMLTWPSIKSLRSHGPYRLVAWIASIALVLLNLEAWFRDPLSLRQLLSWILLMLGVLVLIYGVVSLRRGLGAGRRPDRSLLGIEKTTRLVKSGAYRYIRHPIYSAFLLVGPGVLLKDFTWQALSLCLLVIIATVITAKTEEQENVAYFGQAYRDYMKDTRMFFPFLF